MCEILGTDQMLMMSGMGYARREGGSALESNER